VMIEKQVRYSMALKSIFDSWDETMYGYACNKHCPSVCCAAGQSAKIKKYQSDSSLIISEHQP
jgi:hypothetical protein